MVNICLTKEDLLVANKILEEVLAETGDTVFHFNKALTNLTETPQSDITNQKGGWDPFDLIAKLIISGAISASVFGFYKASGWFLYYLTSCYEVQAGMEICMSSSILPAIAYALKEETKRIGHLTINTQERQRELAKKLRDTYNTVDNFLKVITENDELLLG